VIGDISALPEFVRVPLEDVIKSSKDNTAFTLVVALNYGARQEIVAAAQALAADVAAGKLAPSEVDWSAVETRLQTAGMPDPDLIIRTSGEFRLSNFLLLQSKRSSSSRSPSTPSANAASGRRANRSRLLPKHERPRPQHHRPLGRRRTHHLRIW
jgi:undecaprenyl diphosphate synthase